MEGIMIKVNRSETRIKVSDLTFAYLRDPVLEGVDFSLEPGAVGLLGPNGSGKTTLLRCLLGQVPLDTGRVSVLGCDMARQARVARAGLGWMPERGGIIPGMSGVGLVAYLGELSGMPARDAMQRAHEVLHYVGLADERYRNCDDYSQGMKQRLKLAQALVHDPVWLFLDEPTSGLDPQGRVAILKLIRDLAKNKGMGIVLSTHLLADVEMVCEEILVLKTGRLLAREKVLPGSIEARQVFEVEGFGNEEMFLTHLRNISEEVTLGNRLILVTLDLAKIQSKEAGLESMPSESHFSTTVGVNAILKVAADTDFGLRRVRRQPVSLTDQFYKMVED
jgi:ABC-2 type transport system ATP-binding protein